MNLLGEILGRWLKGETSVNEYSEDDIRTAFAIAKKNKLTLALGIALGKSPIPSDLTEELRIEKIQCAVSNPQLLYLCRKVNDVLSENNITHFFYKGPTQQKILYNNFFIKPSLDIDVMVKRNEFKKAMSVLEANEFTINPHCKGLWWHHFLGEQQYFLKGIRYSVDLHHRFQQPGSPAPTNEYIFFEDMQNTQIGSQSVPVPNNGIILLLITTNLVRSTFSHSTCGNHALDFARSVLSMNNEQLAATEAMAKKTNLWNSLLFCSYVTATVFGIPNYFNDLNYEPLLSGNSLSNIIFMGEDSTTQFPKRTSFLKNLCDKNFSTEYFWLILSEISRFTRI